MPLPALQRRQDMECRPRPARRLTLIDTMITLMPHASATPSSRGLHDDEALNRTTGFSDRHGRCCRDDCLGSRPKMPTERDIHFAATCRAQGQAAAARALLTTASIYESEGNRDEYAATADQPPPTPEFLEISLPISAFNFPKMRRE